MKTAESWYEQIHLPGLFCVSNKKINKKTLWIKLQLKIHQGRFTLESLVGIKPVLLWPMHARGPARAPLQQVEDFTPAADVWSWRPLSTAGSDPLRVQMRVNCTCVHVRKMRSWTVKSCRKAARFELCDKYIKWVRVSTGGRRGSSVTQIKQKRFIICVKFASHNHLRPILHRFLSVRDVTTDRPDSCVHEPPSASQIKTKPNYCKYAEKEAGHVRLSNMVRHGFISYSGQLIQGQRHWLKLKQ